MKKILFVLLAVFLVSGCSEKKKAEEPTCNPIVGGSYTLNFTLVNADLHVESKSVCIACSPDSYEELPVIDDIDGWYYDEELTKKVEGTSTLDIKPVPIYDTNDKECITGYRNITLYAKLEEIMAE